MPAACSEVRNTVLSASGAVSAAGSACAGAARPIMVAASTASDGSRHFIGPLFVVVSLSVRDRRCRKSRGVGLSRRGGRCGPGGTVTGQVHRMNAGFLRELGEQVIKPFLVDLPVLYRGVISL